MRKTLQKISDTALFALTFFIVVLFIGLLVKFPAVKKEAEIYMVDLGFVLDTRPTLIYPENESLITDTKPIFKWEDFFQTRFLTQGYRMELSKDHSFENVLTEGIYKYAFADTLNSLDGGIYFWRVKAISNLEESRWSLKSCFLLGPSSLRYPKIEVIKPFFDRIYYSDISKISPLSFKWLPPLLDTNCFIYPKEYTLQISSDTEFNDIIYLLSSVENNVYLDATEFFSQNIPKGVASTPFFWRVRSADFFENISEWSDSVIFYLVNSTISTL